MKLRKRGAGAAIHTAPSVAPTGAKNTGSFAGRRLGAAPTELEERLSATAAVGNGMRNTSVAQLPIEIDIDPLLKDIVFSEDLEQKKLVMRLFTDIYYNDPTAGSIVDIKSNLMFSEFNLGGILDKKVAQAFGESLENLNIRNLMPHALVDHDVKGAFVGSLLYNEKKKTFVDVMPHGYENCKVDMLPFFNQDPLITVAIPDDVRATMGVDTPRIKAMREYLGAEVIAQINNAALELDAKSTIYLPRQAFTNSTGVSYYRRILPMYLLEKNLFRGTLVESARRQRGILHLTLDGGGEWEPTVADFEMMTQLFQNADADPLGAIIATRSGISADELRQGGDFWKVTDVWDSTLSMKLKALGISEAFLSGDATFSNQDTSMSFFIDGIRGQRDLFVRKMLYNRIFPLISALNGFVIGQNGKLTRRGNQLDKIDPMGNIGILNDGSRLLIPSVHWEKTLKPEGDQQYMDMLQALTEKGVPVPIRAMAAAAGFNIERLLADQQGDKDLMEELSKYNKDIADIKAKYGPADGGDDTAMASAIAGARYLQNIHNGSRSDVLARNNGKMLGLASRDFGEAFEVAGTTHDGKMRYLHDQKKGHERANRKIVKQLQSIRAANNTHLTQMTRTPFKG